MNREISNPHSVEGGEFARKEAAEKYEDAKKLAEIGKLLEGSGIKTPEDILRPEAEIEDHLRGETKKDNQDRAALLRKLEDIKKIDQGAPWDMEMFDSFRRFNDDKEVVLAVINKGLFNQVAGAGALGWASEKLRNDKEVVLAAVKQNGINLMDVSPELSNDRDVVLEAIRQNPRASRYASDEIKKALGLKFEYYDWD